MRRLFPSLLLALLMWAVLPAAAQPESFACRQHVSPSWQPYSGQIVLTDAVTGEQRVVATGLPDPSVLAFDNLRLSPGCAYVTWFSTTDGGETFTFSAWDATTASDTPVFHVSPISPNVVEWSPDGRYLLLRRSLTEDVLVSVPSGRVLATIPDLYPPRIVKWSLAQQRLLVVRTDTDHVLDVLDFGGQQVGTIDLDFQNIYSLAINDAGTTFAIYNSANNPIYDLATLTQVGELPDVGTVRFETDTLVVGFGSRYYDLALGRTTYIPDEVRHFDPSAYTRADDHPYVVIPNTAYEVYVGNLDSGMVTRLDLFAPLLADERTLRALPNGSPYVSGRCASRHQEHAFDVPRRRVLVAPNALCREVIAEFDLSSGAPTTLYTPPELRPGSRLGVVLSPDGAWLVVYATQGGAMNDLWLVRRGTNDWREVPVFNHASARLGEDQFAFSPDGRRMARGSEKITVYDLASASVVTEFEGPAALVRSLRFTDNTTLAVVNNYDGGLQHWDITTGERR